MTTIGSMPVPRNSGGNFDHTQQVVVKPKACWRPIDWQTGRKWHWHFFNIPGQGPNLGLLIPANMGLGDAIDHVIKKYGHSRA